jgi:hypothetical protein
MMLAPHYLFLQKYIHKFDSLVIISLNKGMYIRESYTDTRTDLCYHILHVLVYQRMGKSGTYNSLPS